MNGRPAEDPQDSGEARAEAAWTPVRILADRTALAEAARLARLGHYSEAEALLMTMTCPDRTPAALDLLARIRAQQGRFNEARRLWQLAEEDSPFDESCERGLRRIARIRRSPIYRIRAALRIWLRTRWTNHAFRWSERRAREGNSGDEVPSMAVILGDALFSADGRLSSWGRDTLLALGRRLEPYGDRISIVVQSSCFGIPDLRTSERGALNRARASKVVEHLETVTLLPRSAFAIADSGEDVWIDDSHAVEAAGGTVSITVGPLSVPRRTGDDQEGQ